jgi:hypothetical protein
MKEVFIFIATLSLFGCFVGYDGAGYRDRLILNSYYEMLYIKPSLNLHTSKPAYISHLAHNKKYHVEMYDFKNYEVLIDFYQDSDHKCYLFSKSNKDLFALEKKPYASLKEDQPRIMPPTSQYPTGYWKQTNQYNQPMNPSTGKPGLGQSDTHIPLPIGDK